LSTLRNVQKLSYLRLLLYGKPGSTKTRTSYSAALCDELYPTLVLESGGNPESTYDYERLPWIITLDKLEDMNAPYDWINTGCSPDHKFAKAFGFTEAPKCVIIDGITDVQRLSFGKLTGNMNIGPGDFGSSVTQRHFGTVLEQMTRMSKLFFKLPIHVIVTALEKNASDTSGNLVRVAPLIWGQSETEVSGYALAVGHLTHGSAVSGRVKSYLKSTKQVLGEDDSVVKWSPDGVMQAKDQYGRLGKFMVSPTMRKIYDHIYSGDGAYIDPFAVSVEATP